MSTLRLSHHDGCTPAPIPFPCERARDMKGTPNEFSERVLEQFETMSRRIEDLARELNCLGYFDDDSRPRAA